MGVNEWDAFQLLYTATVYVPQTLLCSRYRWQEMTVSIPKATAI